MLIKVNSTTTQKNWGFPTRMVYLYNDIESRYTILVGNPRYSLDQWFSCRSDLQINCMKDLLLYCRLRHCTCGRTHVRSVSTLKMEHYSQTIQASFAIPDQHCGKTVCSSVLLNFVWVFVVSTQPTCWVLCSMVWQWWWPTRWWPRWTGQPCSMQTPRNPLVETLLPMLLPHGEMFWCDCFLCCLLFTVNAIHAEVTIMRF